MNRITPPARAILDGGISFVSIVTKNDAWNWHNAKDRFKAILAAIEHSGIASISEILCTDNSEYRLMEVEQFLRDAPCPPRTSYEWCQGFNLLYGLAINRMVAKAHYPTVVYFCTNHGRFYDP